MASLKKNSLYIYVCQQSQSINKVPTRFDVYIKGNCNDFFAAMVSVGPPVQLSIFCFVRGCFLSSRSGGVCSEDQRRKFTPNTVRNLT
jgi:hypothetical protein